MMFGYFWWSQWAWITAFYRMSRFNFVQKLLQFLYWKFGRISRKFPDKNEFLEYITQKDSRPTIFIQNGWNFYQMTTTCRGTKLRSIFWKFNFANSSTKMSPKMLNFVDFFHFSAHHLQTQMSIKSPIFKIFPKTLLNIFDP